MFNYLKKSLFMSLPLYISSIYAMDNKRLGINLFSNLYAKVGNYKFRNDNNNIINTTDNSEVKNTALISAIEQGALQTINFLIQKGANVNDSNEKETPLSFTFKKITTAHTYDEQEKYKEIFKTLIQQYKADINCYVRGEKTLLILAIEHAIDHPNENLVDFLMQNGAHVNDYNAYGETPLSFTFRKITTANTHDKREKCKEIFKTLTHNGANINCYVGDNTKTLLMLAIEQATHQDNNLLIDFLMQNGAGINNCNRNRETPLSFTFKKIINANTYDEQEKYKKLFKTLIRYKADINCYVRGEKTLLILAIEHAIANTDKELIIDESLNVKSKKSNIIDFIIQNGARVNDRNVYGETPLSFTFRKITTANTYDEREKCKEIFKTLIRHKANINCYVGNEKTLLMLAIDHAIGHPNENLIDFLLQNKASIHFRNKNKSYNPLLYAITLRTETQNKKHSLEIIEHLLKRQADPKSIKIEEISLLEFAENSNDKTLKNLLLLYDAKPK